MQKPKVAGEICYFELANWWQSTFSTDEREHIELAYEVPTVIGDSEDERVDEGRPLTQGNGGYLFETPVDRFRRAPDTVACRWFPQMSARRRGSDTAAPIDCEHVRSAYPLAVGATGEVAAKLLSWVHGASTPSRFTGILP